ncbi:MAG TPA: hypothetical protein ENN27_05525 [Candidatus Atribacteria bacterium]|nr:hypothetical protein [Candidatus Atribacteria bacterium]
MNWFSFKKKKLRNINPDHIFLDSKNLPSLDEQQFEGRVEKPIKKPLIYLMGFIFLLIGTIFVWRVGLVQVIEGESFAKRSENNKLRHTVIFPERGNIYDRQGEELAWNNEGREYYSGGGLSHILGFIGLPSDNDLLVGNYHPQELIGKSGLEKQYQDILSGEKGLKIEEFNALGEIISSYLLKENEAGKEIYLSIDLRLQEALFDIIAKLAEEENFLGGSGILMNVKNGEILALASYPEYDSNIMTKGNNLEKIREYFSDNRFPFLNRSISGLYTPGSVVKPVMASAALAENIISVDKEIYSAGTLVVPNPYFPDRPSVFKDWRAHGNVDLKRAIAVSSNIYFYYIGGGYKDQKGLGIKKIEEYSRLFGYGEITGIDLPGEAKGIVPNPDWKADRFNNEPWRLGDTYNTVIGQYGFMITPLQVVRSIAIIASDGLITKPTLLLDEKTFQSPLVLDLDKNVFQTVREGMRMATTEGTALSLNVPYTKMAAKTGTAQTGPGNRQVNSWITGFFPYDDPLYAYVIVMERGPSNTTRGGLTAIRQFLDWMYLNTPEYFD